MKVIGICGSPRKGNSDWMVEQVLDAAAECGAESEIIFLRDLRIEYCTGCDICFNTGKPCPIKDDMQELYKKLLEADVVVVGSPNYFKNVSAQLKTFIDRTNALVMPPRLKGKKAISLCVGGQKLFNTEHCERILKEFFKDHKMQLIAAVKARADSPGEVKEQEGLKQKLRELGRSLVEL